MESKIGEQDENAGGVCTRRDFSSCSLSKFDQITIVVHVTQETLISFPRKRFEPPAEIRSAQGSASSYYSSYQYLVAIKRGSLDKMAMDAAKRPKFSGGELKSARPAAFQHPTLCALALALVWHTFRMLTFATKQEDLSKGFVAQGAQIHTCVQQRNVFVHLHALIRLKARASTS